MLKPGVYREISRELNRTRSLSGYPLLRKFSRDIAKWELLLLICNGYNNGYNIGITEYYDLLQNTTKSRLTLTNFLRDCVDDQIFEIKRSGGRKTLIPSDRVINELKSFFADSSRFPNIEERLINCSASADALA